MTYTIKSVDFTQNEDQTISDVKFRLENNEEPWDRFTVKLTWSAYQELANEKGGLVHLLEQRIEHQREAHAQIVAIENTYQNKEVIEG